MSGCREGDLYKKLTIEGREFEIRYGYYSEAERSLWGPTPVYPDFLKTPMYTENGFPYVTAEQSVCGHFQPKIRVSGEDWCHDCRFFRLGEEIIGICTCMEKRQYVQKNE